MTLKLRLLQRGTMTEYAFDRAQISLGRAPSSDLVLGPGAALHHGIIYTSGGDETRFEDISDDGSAIFLRNGEDLEPVDGQVLLISGDFIVLGQSRIELLDVEPGQGPDLQFEQLPRIDQKTTQASMLKVIDALSLDDPIFVVASQLATMAQSNVPGRLRRTIVAIFQDVEEFVDKTYAYQVPEQDGLFADSDVFDVTHNPLLALSSEQRQRVYCVLERTGQLVQCVLPSGRSALFLGLHRHGQLGGMLALEWEGPSLVLGDDFAQSLGFMKSLGDVALRLERRESRARSVSEENRYFLERERRHYLYKALICESPPMRRVYKALNLLVEQDVPVLIFGEAGSGKELLARALHHLGERKDGMFISVHCGHLAPDVLELELFGCVASVLDGALAARKGVFELAHQGTVYLEEVHLMPLSMQSKLVRMLNEGEIRRIGDAVGRKINARVVVSTHVDLPQLVREGQVRQDLYLLLREQTLLVPPLRDRQEDLMSLARIFLRKFASRYDRQVLTFDEDVQAVLTAHDWPGNIRELQTLIEAAVLETDSAASSISLSALTIT